MSEATLVTGERAELLLDLGKHPVAHKYLPEADAPEDIYDIKLGIGRKTGLVGLINPPEWQALTPIYPWVQCHEPEEHLDRLADRILEFVPSGANVLGLSEKDLTFLKRLKRRGVGSAALFKHPMLKGLTRPGVEVVQAALSHKASVSQQYDLIVGRHILEHTWQTRSFLENLQSMLTDNGVLMLEVPDNHQAFTSGQHTIIWEEHSLYFTEHTLVGLLREYGLVVECLNRYPMALEDILVVVLSKGKSNQSAAPETDQERQLVHTFVSDFDGAKEFYAESLTNFRKQHGSVAILGAGHLGAAFINYYGLSQFIDIVIDDDPNKQGLFMPGSRLPIRNSSVLNNGEVSLCLLTCNPWNNEKVAANNADFLAHGGQFLSIFDRGDWA